MAIITYQTDKIEAYLNKIYPDYALSVQTTKLGGRTDCFEEAGHFETLSKKIKVKDITGIDVPIWVSTGSNSNKKTVAIVAQDPLRNKNDKMLTGVDFKQPIIGTPFALHYKQDKYPQTEVYRRIIAGLLNEFDVYITDAHKIYSRDITFGRDKKREIDTLKNEFTARKPAFVITFGTTAKEYVKFPNLKTLNLLHPSQTNWDHWKQWIFEQALEGNKKYGVDWATYAKQIGCRKDMFGSYKPDVNMHEVIANIVLDMVKHLNP